MFTDGPDAFRAAMRHLATTVSLVTAADADGRWYGMPATAVASVSLDPPSLLVCINQSASMHAPVVRSGAFCVNVLSDDHADLCKAFGARASAERFQTGNWKAGPRGIPFLTNSAAVLDCTVEQQLEFGTHSVFIGRVLDTSAKSECRPLVYADAAMHRLEQIA